MGASAPRTPERVSERRGGSGRQGVGRLAAPPRAVSPAVGRLWHARGMHEVDRFSALRSAVQQAILGRDGVTDRATRRRAYDGEGEQGAIAAYVATVQRNAYRVDDEMMAAVRQAGLGDDAIFELTVATAVGEATRQFDAAMAALAAALAESEG